MTPRILKTEADYHEALACAQKLIQAGDLAPAQEDELELLVVLIEHYEAREVPTGPPDSLSAIRSRMEAQNLKPKDMVPYLGSAARVSEVLSGKRELSLSMMRRLHEGLGISLEVLIQPVPKAKPARRPEAQVQRPRGASSKARRLPSAPRRKAA